MFPGLIWSFDLCFHSGQMSQSLFLPCSACSKASAIESYERFYQDKYVQHLLFVPNACQALLHWHCYHEGAECPIMPFELRPPPPSWSGGGVGEKMGCPSLFLNSRRLAARRPHRCGFLFPFVLGR